MFNTIKANITTRSTMKERRSSFRRAMTAFGVTAACLAMLVFAGMSAERAASAEATAGTWTQQFGGANAEVLQFSRTDANHLWASGSYGRIMRTTDGGQNWATTLMPDPVMVMHSIKFVDNEVGWAVGEWHSQGVLLQSTDGGVTWALRNEPSGQRLFGVAALDRQTLMVVGGGTYFAVTRRSTDGGATWTDMPVPLNDSMFLDIFFVDANN
jgi:photosystem II stability/assembly factor-like uncharacterized protein